MMSGVPLEICWAFNKFWNNKFYYKAASCWYFSWVILRCTGSWISNALKECVFWKAVLIRWRGHWNVFEMLLWGWAELTMFLKEHYIVNQRLPNSRWCLSVLVDRERFLVCTKNYSPLQYDQQVIVLQHIFIVLPLRRSLLPNEDNYVNPDTKAVWQTNVEITACTCA